MGLIVRQFKQVFYKKLGQQKQFALKDDFDYYGDRFEEIL
jgi:hypothetical protein